jgi:hypothetical protein
MRGYAYIDIDGNIVYKTAAYIESINPGFFSQNIHLITKHWKFNTEDPKSMMRLFQSINDQHPTVRAVENFVKSINFDMNSLRNANKI